VFTDYGPNDLVPTDPKWAEKFLSRVMEVAERIARNKAR
jgi:GrpB-like predicted nucleotidyltransferase (UPF0157 family)